MTFRYYNIKYYIIFLSQNSNNGNKNMVCMISGIKSIKYLRYKNFEDLFKIILAHSQSALGLSPLVYQIMSNNMKILFIHNGTLGNGIVHFVFCDDELTGRFVELNKMTGKFKFVDEIGNDTKAIYVPILKLEFTTFKFPMQ